MTWIALAALNLVCILIGYFFLACAIARWQWRNRGLGLVFLAILVCGLIWIIPQLLATKGFGLGTTLLPLWFGNWLGSVFAVALFGHFLKGASSDLVDAAQLDGCGPIRICRYIIMPLIKPAFILIAIFVFLATFSVFLAPILSHSDFGLRVASQFIPVTEAKLPYSTMIIASVVTSVPVMLYLLIARRNFHTATPV